MTIFVPKLAFVVLVLLLTAGTASSHAEFTAPKSLDGYALQMKAVTNADGTVMLFYVRPDREIAFVRQTAVNSDEWTKPAGMDLYGNRLSVSHHADGRLALFVIGSLGNVLTHVSQTAPNADTWTQEEEFENAYGTQIEAAANQDGSLVLFFIKPSREIAFIRQAAPNSKDFLPQVDMDVYANQISAANHSDGRIEIAIIGTAANVTSRVTQIEPNGEKWSEEKVFKDIFATQVEFTKNADSSLMLFLLAPDKELTVVKQISRDGEVFSKLDETDVYGSRFTTGMNRNGAIEVFIIGTLGNVISRIVQTEPNGSQFGKETELKGYALQLEAVANADGTLNLFSIAPLASELHLSIEKN